MKLGKPYINYENDLDECLTYFKWFFLNFKCCFMGCLTYFCTPGGGFTPCQVEHHVQTKFATPILHAIDSFKDYDIFSTYT